MSDSRTYFEYLKGRRCSGLLYRRLYLYPRLCRHLSGLMLDVGCGLGDMLRFRRHTIGVDVNPDAVRYCRSLGLNAFLIERECMPFSSGSFDCALLDNVLEHIVDPTPLLAETQRVLKEQGTLVVGVPGKRGYAHDPDHKKFYDEQTLVETLEALHFATQAIFHLPFPSSTLSTKLRQYCVYGAFRSS